MAGLLTALLLVACAGTFKFRVQTSAPAEVASVFVLFGDQADFDEADSPPKIVGLVQPSKLKNYQGYVEYELITTEGESHAWQKLNERLPPKTIKLKLDDPAVLAFSVKHKLLKTAPQLGVAVVAVTSDSNYLLKVVSTATVAEAEDPLTFNVTADAIRDTFN